jgi:outer membrane lipoprotein-sorting protein
LHKFLLILNIVLSTTVGLAADSRPVELAEIVELQKRLKQSKYLSMEFTQKKYSSMRDKTSSKVGRAKFTRPNMFRWSLLTPTPNEWLYNGDVLHQYHSDLKQATKYNIQGGQVKNIKRLVKMVLDIEALLGSYTFEKATEENNVIRVELSSDGKDGIKSVVLDINREKNYVSFLKLIFRNKDFLATSFAQPVHSEIKSTEYIPPKSVKIIDGGF